jgi:predicted nucleic acid-binding protein
MIVVDTNVISYLLIAGDRTEACRKVLQKDPSWAAPFLWRSEFRNVLCLHMRHSKMSLEGAISRSKEAMKLLYGREYSITSELLLELVQESPISAYDAEFVCLAERMETKLITTDKKILKLCHRVAISPEEFIET